MGYRNTSTQPKKSRSTETQALLGFSRIMGHRGKILFLPKQNQTKNMNTETQSHTSYHIPKYTNTIYNIPHKSKATKTWLIKIVMELVYKY